MYRVDPDFDPDQRAFYYVRVIEIPKPRWTAYDAKFFGVDMPDEVPRLHLADLVHALKGGVVTNRKPGNMPGFHSRVSLLLAAKAAGKSGRSKAE